MFPGGYYTIELAKRRLRLISLNTNLYLSTSLRERYSYDLDTEESWAWLHKVMAQAKSKGQNVSKLFVLTLKLGGKMGRSWADSRRKFRSYRVTWAVWGDPSNNGNGERAQAKCIDAKANSKGHQKWRMQGHRILMISLPPCSARRNQSHKFWGLINSFCQNMIRLWFSLP